MRNLFGAQRPWLNIVGIAIIMAIFVFTGVRIVSGPYWFKSMDLSDKGTLGDAVNGLSAPFISFFSAILIYITFREQVKANKLLQSQWQIDTFLKIFNDMSNRLKGISIQLRVVSANSFGGVDNIEVHGLSVFDHLAVKDFSSVDEAPEELIELIYVIDEMTFLAELVNEAPENRREFMRQKLVRFYLSGLHSTLYTLKEKLPAEKGSFRAFAEASQRLHVQLREFVTLRDFKSANGEGQLHDEMKVQFEELMRIKNRWVK